MAQQGIDDGSQSHSAKGLCGHNNPQLKHTQHRQLKYAQVSQKTATQTIKHELRFAEWINRVHRTHRRHDFVHGFSTGFQMRDKEIMQRSMMEAKHRDQTKFMGIHQSITEVSRFWVSELREVCSDQTQR
jgi:hypothetical protein